MTDNAVPKRIIVIGGGISGLAAAHHLLEWSRQRHVNIDVNLLEAGPRLGGVIHTIHRDGFTIEAGPDNFITTKPAGVALCRRLGLEPLLQGTTTQHRGAMVVRGKRLLPIPEGFLLMAPSQIMPIVTSRIFSPWGKLRMAMEPFVPARRGGADESLASFVTRRFGSELLDRLVQPLVGGIYTADPQRLSVRTTLPRFLDMEVREGSLIKAMRKTARTRGRATETGARYSMFVTLKPGMSALPEAIAGRIGRDRIHLHTAVTRVERDGSCDAPWSITAADGRSWRADAVIVACPTPAAASILSALDAELSHQLSAIDYASSAVVHLAFRRDQIGHALNSFGFVVPHRERRAILACSFNSVKYEGRAPAGWVLLRAFLGGKLQETLLERDDAELMAAARNDLAELLDIRGAPAWCMIHRWHKALAQYDVGHLDRIKAIRDRAASHPGLFLAGNGFEGVGIPDCIAEAERAAAQLISASCGIAVMK